MIEKWKDNNDMFQWCNDVRLQMEEKTYDEHSPHSRYLTYDLFADILFIAINTLTTNEKRDVVDIVLMEGSHDATDARESNVKFIKEFVSNEIPYLTYLERKDFDLRYGFALRYVIKEENNVELIQ